MIIIMLILLLVIIIIMFTPCSRENFVTRQRMPYNF